METLAFCSWLKGSKKRSCHSPIVRRWIFAKFAKL